MGSVQDLLTLADRVAKLDAVATAVGRAESCVTARPEGAPISFDRRVQVRLTFLDEPAARAFVDALAALAAKPAAGPRPTALVGVGPVAAGGVPTVNR